VSLTALRALNPLTPVTAPTLPLSRKALNVLEPSDLRVLPFGTDSLGRQYFYFGFKDCRICKRVPPSAPRRTSQRGRADRANCVPTYAHRQAATDEGLRAWTCRLCAHLRKCGRAAAADLGDRTQRVAPVSRLASPGRDRRSSADCLPPRDVSLLEQLQMLDPDFVVFEKQQQKLLNRIAGADDHDVDTGTGGGGDDDLQATKRCVCACA
jgi:hypothetical protein